MKRRGISTVVKLVMRNMITTPRHEINRINVIEETLLVNVVGVRSLSRHRLYAQVKRIRRDQSSSPWRSVMSKEDDRGHKDPEAEMWRWVLGQQ